MTRFITLLLVSAPLLASAQWLNFQSVKVEYDALGNRIVRKLYDPNELENKRSQYGEDQSLRGDGISAFPNPAASEATLQLDAPDSQTVAITIYNATGQRVGTSAMLPGTVKTTLDLSRLAPGMYHVQAVTDSRKRTLTLIHE